jgi:CRISPR-associated exonuclease Cas4
MFTDDDLVMISAIEHYSYCPRQCALIHVEQVYDENVFTLRGSRAHERVDAVSWEMDGTTRIERALPLWSDRLGLIGRADTVEFREDGTIFPVEYKHGPRREHIHDDLQLCAQAVCLEEIFSLSVTGGAIYHHSSRRRREVEFTADLRNLLEATVLNIREMRTSGVMPPPVNDARCPNCSLVDSCVPAALVSGRQAYHQRRLYALDTDPECEAASGVISC